MQKKFKRLTPQTTTTTTTTTVLYFCCLTHHFALQKYLHGIELVVILLLDEIYISKRSLAEHGMDYK